MSVVNVEAIEKQRKLREEVQKKMKKEAEKTDKRIKLKATKTPAHGKGTSRASVAPEPEEEEPVYRANEWIQMAYGLGFKALSLPAGRDKEKLEAELKESQDMKVMMSELPMKSIYEQADPKFLYLLSYASKLAKVKIEGYQQQRIAVVNETNVMKADNKEVKQDFDDDYAFETVSNKKKKK